MRTILFQLALLIISNTVIAQDYQRKFTLQQCLDLAIHNSYAAYKANLDISEAGYHIHEVRSNVLPQISASGSFDYSILLPTTMIPGEIIGQPGTQIPVHMGTKNVLDFGATIEQVIFAPTLFTGIKIAKNNLELQRLRATMTKEEVIFNVSNAFYDILNNMQELENVNYMISRQDSLYVLIKKQVEENVTREIDLNRIKINLTGLQARGKNVKNTIWQQKRYLQILIGMPIESAFELDDSEIKNIQVSGLRAYSAPQNKIELEVLDKQKEILELEIHNQKANYLPTLSAVTTAGYQFQSDKLNLLRKPWFSSAIIGARLSIPIFDGLSNRSKIEQKQILLQGLYRDIRETQQNISANYQNAKNQLGIIYELIQDQSENLKLAEKVYFQTMALYTEGLADITDLLETESSLHEAKIAYTTELLRYKKTEIDLLKASGTLENLLSYNKK
jgi:outer membrane protein TolC